MSHAPPPIPTPGQLLSLLRRYHRRWLVPALAVGLLVGLYALVRPARWEASQALIVRNEAANGEDQPGKFTHSEEMKTAQETILELAKSRSVLAGALAQVGPPADHKATAQAWPSERDVADLREAVRLSPPKGAEFGKTEVFYVQVRDRSRDRAVALVASICDQLETRCQALRDARAQSMIDELGKAVHLTRDDLAESTSRLGQIEQQVGTDLAELRSLQEWGAGESTLRRTIAEIRNELREAQSAEKSSQELLAFLQSAQEDPDRLVATPNRLLESQPALRRLKEGLVDAQLRTAELAGRMADAHPLLLAARESERVVGRHLHDELATAVRGIQVDLRLSRDRVAMLRSGLEAAGGRLERLAAVRAPYENLVAETRNRSQLLERAEGKLAEARLSQAGAKAASLIGRIDTPQPGIDPVGPGRLMIALAGLAGGLLAGLGTLLLTVELTPPAPAQAGSANGQANGRVNGRVNGQANGRDLPQPLDEGNGSSRTVRPARVLSVTQALERITGIRPNGS